MVKVNYIYPINVSRPYSGKISIENMTISDQNNKYKEVITKSFENTVSSLPKLYPAIKRGQEVDVIFNIPIIISTEN